MRFFLCLLHICLGFSLVAADTSKVEEGWRYQDTIELTVTNGSVTTSFGEDFLKQVHAPMAYIVDMAKTTYSTKEKDVPLLPDPSGRMFAMFRFTPVMQTSEGSDFTFGKTVSLFDVKFNDASASSATQFNCGYECIFTSGFFKIGEEKTKLIPDIKVYGASYNQGQSEKKDVFVRIPPIASSHIPSVFIMRNYIDPQYLRTVLISRYLEDLSSSILAQGNYTKIREVHAVTLSSLDERAKKIRAVLGQASQDADFTDISTLLHSTKILESDKRNVGNNAKANSYSCAEQLGLDFMSDLRIIDYLQKATNVADEKIVGVIVHVHTSETPCGGACATSLVRESENGGLFRRIFNNKQIKIICTTSEHYKRPDQQIPYGDTNFNGELRSLEEKPCPLQFSFTVANEVSAYPVILYGRAENANVYSVLREKYGQMRRQRDE